METSKGSTEGLSSANRRLESLMRHVTLLDPNQILRFSIVNGDSISDVTIRDDYTCTLLPVGNQYSAYFYPDFVA